MHLRCWGFLKGLMTQTYPQTENAKRPKAQWRTTFSLQTLIAIIVRRCLVRKHMAYINNRRCICFLVIFVRSDFLNNQLSRRCFLVVSGRTKRRFRQLPRLLGRLSYGDSEIFWEEMAREDESHERLVLEGFSST